MMKLPAQPQTSKIIRAFVASYHAFIQAPQTSGFWLSIWNLKISDLKMMDQCRECTNKMRIKEAGADDDVAGSATNIKNHLCIRGNLSCFRPRPPDLWMLATNLEFENF